LRQPHPDLLFSAARYLAAESRPAIKASARSAIYCAGGIGFQTTTANGSPHGG
jgi:hypothetical protein